jgi:hypothetical protein
VGARRIPVHDENPIERDAPCLAGPAELAHILRPITAAADDDDGAELETSFRILHDGS